MLTHDRGRRAVLRAGALATAGFATSLSGCASLDALTAPRAGSALPVRGEWLIHGATVLTLDPRLGDFPRGDVHVRNGTIVAVGAKVDAPGAARIDGAGMICLPGFIDTHWHLWTTICRPIVRIDDPKRGYFPVTNLLGRHYTPEDSYRAVRLGMAEAISAGVTTVHNWAHNIRSGAHAEAELRAMRETGLRGRFSYGPSQGMPDEEPMDLAPLERIQREQLPGDGLITLGINSRNVGSDPNPLRGNIPLPVIRADWGGARRLGVPITLHTSGPSPITFLEQAGLLGPDVQLVHPLLTTAEERKILARRGVSYSISPVGESRRPASAGVIQLGELLEAGVKVSLSIDHTSTYTVDMFQVMRLLYNLHQHRIGARVPVTARRMVQLATLDGAIDLGIADRTGSLTPGKRADLILVNTREVNIAPAGDPYEALLSFAQPRNVHTVIADGRMLWREGRFTALDYARVLADGEASAQALRQRAGWAG